MTLFMETTDISPERTVHEIQKTLMEHGAGAILTEFENGEVAAVSFKYQVGESYIPFRLPCRWKAIEKIFNDRDHSVMPPSARLIQEKRKLRGWHGGKSSDGLRLNSL